MTCKLCNYEWCWVCGLNYHSIIHYAQLGGVICEMIGLISFSELTPITKGLLLLLFVVFFPLFVLGICLILVACLMTFIYQETRIFERINTAFVGFYTSLQELKDYRNEEKLFSCLIFLPWLVLRIITFVLHVAILLTLVAIYLAVTLAVGWLLFRIMILPSYLLLFLVLLRKFYIWSWSERKPMLPIMQPLLDKQTNDLEAQT